jgi:hypothetical protein
VLKAMQRNPDHRYASAADLAADLNRYLEGRPVIARQTPAHELLWKAIRRNRAAAAGVLFLILAAGGGAAWWLSASSRPAAAPPAASSSPAPASQPPAEPAAQQETATASEPSPTPPPATGEAAPQTPAPVTTAGRPPRTEPAGRVPVTSAAQPAAAQVPAQAESRPQPQPEVTSTAPAPVLPPSPPAGLRERLLQVGGRVRQADATFAQMEKDVASRGLSLSADLVANRQQMHMFFDMAQGDYNSGNYTSATDGLDRAEAFASRILRAGGRR